MFKNIKKIDLLNFDYKNQSININNEIFKIDQIKEDEIIWKLILINENKEKRLIEIKKNEINLEEYLGSVRV
jgi:hypothetical protein